jgi:hypothetical protein
MNKNRFLVIVLIFLVLITYLFLYLGIELELKFSVESIGVKFNRLIGTSFRIRKFATIQLVLFLIVLFSNIYFLSKRK